MTTPSALRRRRERCSAACSDERFAAERQAFRSLGTLRDAGHLASDRYRAGRIEEATRPNSTVSPQISFNSANKPGNQRRKPRLRNLLATSRTDLVPSGSPRLTSSAWRDLLNRAFRFCAEKRRVSSSRPGLGCWPKLVAPKEGEKTSDILWSGSC